MPIVYPDPKLIPVTKTLMACLVEAAMANPKPPKLTGFRTGTAGDPLSALHGDECCRGAAFVRVIRTFPSWSAPTPASMSTRCAQPMAAEFEISMWRCAPIGDMNQAPRQSAWDELHEDLLNDRRTMLAAVCCFIGKRNPGTVMYGDWQTVPTDGGCAGATMTIQADLY